MTAQYCKKCKQWKPEEAFYVYSTAYRCRECTKAYAKGWYAKNRKKVKEYEKRKNRKAIMRAWHKAHPCYNVWKMMVYRCTNSSFIGWKHYGGRGIRVCKEWADEETGYEAFLAHIGPRPSLRYTVDRIDNDGNYEPGNVRWATGEQQAANRGRNGNQAVSGTGN